MLKIRFIAFLIATTILQPLHSYADPLAPHLKTLTKMQTAALVAESSDPKYVVYLNPDQQLIPASTMKIITAWLALEKWGPDHRFETHFFRQNNTLWIKGMGDPYLTSEEILLIANQLATQTELSSIERIAVDHSLFPELKLSGKGQSDNPYDAGNAALAVNFNSINIEVGKEIRSAESQTPLTPLAKKLATKLKPGISRISLPGGRDMSAHYFAQVFSELVFKQQLPISIAKTPTDAKSVYQHQNSQNLAEMVKGMLRYSNNYIANQIYLLLPEQFPVSPKRSQQYVSEQLKLQFQWQQFQIADGAGLSRKNRLSATQLIEVLDRFRPWAHLLPPRKKRILAKTGTMSGIRTYAGYYLDSNNHWQSFALLMNKPSKWHYRYKVAESLLERP